MAGYAAGKVRLFDVGKEKAIRDFQGIGKDDLVSHLAVSADGKRFAAADASGSVTLWETATGKEIAALSERNPANIDFNTGLALSDDGNTVMTMREKINSVPGFPRARLTFWNATTKKGGVAYSVECSGLLPMLVQKGRLLFGGGPNLFEIWSIKDRIQLESWGGHPGPVSSLAVLPNADIVSAGQYGGIAFWHSGRIVNRHPSGADATGVLAKSGDRKHWLAAAGHNSIHIYSANGENPLHVFKGHTGPITSLAFSKEGWAASGSSDRTAKTWDLKAGKEIASFAGHSEGVNAVAVSPDDGWLATGSDDTTIKLWPIKAGKLDSDREAITLEGHKKPVTCLAFSPDGKTLISGSQDQTLKVWDWAKEKAIRTIPGHRNWISSCCSSMRKPPYHQRRPDAALVGPRDGQGARPARLRRHRRLPALPGPGRRRSPAGRQLELAHLRVSANAAGG